jgi:hypothetical protein
MSLGVHVPPLPIRGGCQCGRVRYELGGPPLVFYLCHCRECQRQTSSAFGESLRVRREDLTVGGEVRVFARVSDAGNRREGWFCQACGVRVVHATAGSDEVNIKAGTLDDTSWLRPAGHIWTASRQPFLATGDGELDYFGQPDDGYAALAERWREMLAQS